jgi:hypothetical protein
MNKLIRIICIGLLCLFFGVAITGRRATLVTLEPLRIDQTIDGQMSISLVAKNTRLPVIRCVDTKSLIIPEVRLPEGKTGYAVYGNFKMEYDSALSFSAAAPISFSCP